MNRNTARAKKRTAAPVTLRLDREQGRLWRDDGRCFEPHRRAWHTPEDGTPGTGGEEIAPVDAVGWLQKESGTPCRVPVSVIGPRTAKTAQKRLAEALGAGLARLGLSVLCGGAGGVMEATCRGVAKEGGISIGLLPDDNPESANRYVTVPVATGIGVARNALIARAGICVAAVGGGLGTLSEAALARQFGKEVFVLADGPEVLGAWSCADLEAALSGIARVVLGLPPDP